MTNRSPRTILAISAAVALTVGALAPTAAMAKGPGGGNADCDGDCTADQPQAQEQIQARDGSGDQAQARARGGSGSGQQTTTEANAAGGGQVRARANDSGNQNATQAAGRNQNTNQKASQGQGRNANQNASASQGQGRNAKEDRQGAGNGPNEDGERGPGSCDECDAEMGELTEEQMAGLVFMVNEEKLAHDVYVKFAELYGTRNFANIAESEARHQEAVRVVLERYGIEDPTADMGVGEFSDPIIDSLYTTLVEQGSASLEDALAAAVTIEETDIADLERRLVGLEESAPDVYEMYSHLLTASGYHLEAFEAWLS